MLDEIPTVHAYVATKKLHHNDYDLKHFSQVFSMQFMAKFGACQARLLENIEIRMPRPLLEVKMANLNDSFSNKRHLQISKSTA